MIPDIGVFQISTSAYGAILEHLLGVRPEVRPIEELRWEDDGGPPFPESERWTHTIRPGTPASLTI